jgi:hypothetical protein
LVNAIINVDPLHNKEATVRVILDEWCRVPHWHKSKHLQAPRGSFSGPEVRPFFELSCEGGHGRIETRKASVEPISPVTAGLLGDRCAIIVQRDWCEKKPFKSPIATPFLPLQSVGEGKQSSFHASRPRTLEHREPQPTQTRRLGLAGRSPQASQTQSSPCLPSFHSNKENPRPASSNFTTATAEKPSILSSTPVPFHNQSSQTHYLSTTKTIRNPMAARSPNFATI